MITEQDVYCAFRKAQSRFLGRAYKLPKDFETFLENMNPVNRVCLTDMSKFLNTKWSIIELDMYFDIGFELFGSGFTYRKFFDNKILKMYITRDKLQKRDSDNINDDLKKSKEYVNITFPGDDYTLYGARKVGEMSVAIKDYLSNNIGKYFVTFLIRNNYLKLSDTDRMKIPLIVENYREYLFKLEGSKSNIKNNVTL
jgi:hypothetical protein